MRTRNIKPAFFDNEELAELPYCTRLFFIGLWCVADKLGRLEQRNKRLKKDLFGYDDISDGDIDKMLSELEMSGFVARYEVNNQKYVQVINFVKHQHTHRNEKPNADIPPYSDEEKKIPCVYEVKEPRKIVLPKKEALATDRNVGSTSKKSVSKAKPKRITNVYGEYKNVNLTDEEYARLKEEYADIDEIINFFSAYIEEKNYDSKNHNLAIRRWVINAYERQKPKKKSEPANRLEFNLDDVFEMPR